MRERKFTETWSIQEIHYPEWQAEGTGFLLVQLFSEPRACFQSFTNWETRYSPFMRQWDRIVALLKCFTTQEWEQNTSASHEAGGNLMKSEGDNPSQQGDMLNNERTQDRLRWYTCTDACTHTHAHVGTLLQESQKWGKLRWNTVVSLCVCVCG